MSQRLVVAVALASRSLLPPRRPPTSPRAARPPRRNRRAPAKPEFRALYKELVEINTTLSVGSCTDAANAMKARSDAPRDIADAQLQVIVPPGWPKHGNLVAVLPGTTRSSSRCCCSRTSTWSKPSATDWERDPFKLVEEDGFFYARGASDDKAMAAVFADSMVRFKKEGYRPKRGIKLALTCGEETPNIFNGVKYLIENHRDLIDAGVRAQRRRRRPLRPEDRRVSLRRGAGRREGLPGLHADHAPTRAGTPRARRPTTRSTNSRTRSTRSKRMQFKVEFNDTSRAYFEKFGAIEGGEKGADMIAAAKSGDAGGHRTAARRTRRSNAILRTNCVATQLAGGHAPNALPQRATANVNCRIFPGPHADGDPRRNSIAAIGDPGVSVEFQSPPETPGAPPPLSREVMAPIEALSARHVPGRRRDPDHQRRARPTAASSRPRASRRTACPACWATAPPATRTASTSASACRR